VLETADIGKGYLAEKLAGSVVRRVTEEGLRVWGFSDGASRGRLIDPAEEALFRLRDYAARHGTGVVFLGDGAADPDDLELLKRVFPDAIARDHRGEAHA
jgi:hypothetical protein